MCAQVFGGGVKVFGGGGVKVPGGGVKVVRKSEQLAGNCEVEPRDCERVSDMIR